MTDLITEAIAVIAKRKDEEFFAKTGTPERARQFILEEIYEMNNIQFLELISEALILQDENTGMYNY